MIIRFELFNNMLHNFFHTQQNNNTGLMSCTPIYRLDIYTFLNHLPQRTHFSQSCYMFHT